MITRGTSIARLAWTAVLACLLLAASLGTARAAIVLPAESEPRTDGDLWHHAGIGCKLIGGAMVCGRDGGGLLDRKILPRKRKETNPVQKKPAKPAPKKSTPSKTTSGGSKSNSSGTGGGVQTEAPGEEPAETVEDDAEAEELHSCPPGHVVLEEPNVSGSHCEPVGAASPASKTPPAPTKKEKPADPDDKTTPLAPSAKPDTPDEEPKPVTEPPPGSTEIPDDIRAAACGPDAAPKRCACPGGSAYDNEACRAALPSCCSATVSADGKPQPAISRCGTDQNKAMSAVVSSAMEKKLTLGPVRCTNR
jgi:hypothetical protein